MPLPPAALLTIFKSSRRETGSTPTEGSSKQDQFGAAGQRADQSQFLFHAAGKLSRKPFLKGAKAGKGKHCGKIAADVFQNGVKLQIFPHRQVFVKAELLRHVTDFGGKPCLVLHRIQPADGKAAGVRQQQSSDQPEKGGFAGAVGADQTDRLPFFNRQRQMIDGSRFAAGESLDQILCFKQFSPSSLFSACSA